MRLPGLRTAIRFAVVLSLATAGCASRGAGRGGKDEGILGEGSSEGKVIEGKITPLSSRAAGSESGQLGFRVQLIASTSRGEAERVAEAIRDKLSERVYIEYFEPYFKVRVGDFLSREEAEEVRVQVVVVGFPDAWIVETPIDTE